VVGALDHAGQRYPVKLPPGFFSILKNGVRGGLGFRLIITGQLKYVGNVDARYFLVPS